jgi:hypothetical protein
VPRHRFEQQLEALQALKATGPTPETERSLQKALTHRNNYYVSKAAAAIQQLSLKQLIPDLIAAYTRFFDEDDPQCWAKNALIKALAELGHNDPEVFLRGLAHIQMEPVFGGREDTAGPLRADCALALIGCPSLTSMQVLQHLLPVLVDPLKSVRIEVPRALVRLGRDEGSLLLRLRALQGDPDPEVLGALFNSIIALERHDGVRFTAQFLTAEGDASEEAALALGESRTPEAFEALKHRLDNLDRPELRQALITAIALTRLSEATEYLLSIIRSGRPGAAEAKQALLAYGALSEPDRTALQCL